MPPHDLWPDKMPELVFLWNEGLTTSEIAHRLGVTKSAVIGKAHRLGLSRRNSPIIRRPPPPELKTFANLAPDQCRYPLGGLREKPTEWCGDKVVTGRSYCEKHCRVVYLPKSSKPAEKPFVIERKGAT